MTALKAYKRPDYASDTNHELRIYQFPLTELEQKACKKGESLVTMHRQNASLRTSQKGKALALKQREEPNTLSLSKRTKSHSPQQLPQVSLFPSTYPTETGST